MKVLLKRTARFARSLLAGACTLFFIATGFAEEEVIEDELKQEVWGQIQQSYYDCADDSAYYDDITGESLDPALVADGIKEEMDTYKSHGVYNKVPIHECIQNTGKKPIKVRCPNAMTRDIFSTRCARVSSPAVKFRYSRLESRELLRATREPRDGQRGG